MSGADAVGLLALGCLLVAFSLFAAVWWAERDTPDPDMQSDDPDMQTHDPDMQMDNIDMQEES